MLCIILDYFCTKLNLQVCYFPPSLLYVISDLTLQHMAVSIYLQYFLVNSKQSSSIVYSSSITKSWQVTVIGPFSFVSLYLHNSLPSEIMLPPLLSLDKRLFCYGKHFILGYNAI